LQLYLVSLSVANFRVAADAPGTEAQAWVSGTLITPSPEGAIYPIPQTNLHDGGTEAQRKTGGFFAPQATRADGRAPLLIQEGDGAFAPGGGYELQDGSERSGLWVVAGRALANRAILRLQRLSVVRKPVTITRLERTTTKAPETLCRRSSGGVGRSFLAWDRHYHPRIRL